MSLYGALFSGVSGLSAQSSAMGAISDNISNVNTTGYKGAKVNFSTLVTKQVSLTNYSPGGVQSRPRASIDVQGLLQATNSSTDVALSGQGFFIVNEAAKPGDGDMFAYSRAGSFKVDTSGYLQNTSGWYLQGWPLMAWDNSLQASTVTVGNNTYMKGYKDDLGNTVYINDNIVSSTHLQPMNLNEIGGTASQTRNLRMGANLPNGDLVGAMHKQPVTIYDSLGGDATVQFNWTKSSQNNWALEGIPPLGAKSLTLRNTNAAGNAGAVYSTMGRLDFLGLPKTTGALTMNINGKDYTFNTKGGVDGSNSRTFYTDPTATATGTFVGNLANDINTAMNIEYNSIHQTPSYVTTGGTVYGTGTTITLDNGVDDPLTVDLSGKTAAQAATALNGPPPLVANVTATAVGNTLQINNAGGTAATIQAVGDLAALDGMTAPAGSNTGPIATQYSGGTAYPVGTTITIGNTTRDVSGMDATAAETYLDAEFPGIDFTAGAGGQLSVTNNSGASILINATGGLSDLNGQAIADTVTGGPYLTDYTADSVFGDGSSLTVGSTVINLDGMTMDLAITAINQVTTTTNVKAVRNGHELALIATQKGQINITGAGALAGFTGTIPGTGVTYCEQLAGTDSLVFRQTSTTQALTVSGLDSLDLGTGTPATRQGQDLIDSDTFTLEAAPDSAGSAIEFKGDGTPKDINVGFIDVDWANGAEDMDGDSSIGFFLGNTGIRDGMTQLDGDYQMAYWNQNGAKFGNFAGVSIGTDGIVTALFDNGVTRPVFQIPVATFVNANGLESLTGNVFIATDNSGEPTLREAGSAGAGQVNSASLEASTVDIGEEFTTMIVTQRAYSAAAKIITTADQMLDELVQIKR